MLISRENSIEAHRQKRAEYQRQYRARKKRNDCAEGNAWSLIHSQLSGGRQSAYFGDSPWMGAQIVLNAASVVYDLDPREGLDFGPWVEMRVKIGFVGFIEQIKEWLDEAVSSGELSLSDLDYSESISDFRDNYDPIVSAVQTHR